MRVFALLVRGLVVKAAMTIHKRKGDPTTELFVTGPGGEVATFTPSRLLASKSLTVTTTVEVPLTAPLTSTTILPKAGIPQVTIITAISQTIYPGGFVWIRAGESFVESINVPETAPAPTIVADSTTTTTSTLLTGTDGVVVTWASTHFTDHEHETAVITSTISSEDNKIVIIGPEGDGWALIGVPPPGPFPFPPLGGGGGGGGGGNGGEPSEGNEPNHDDDNENDDKNDDDEKDKENDDDDDDDDEDEDEKCTVTCTETISVIQTETTLSP